MAMGLPIIKLCALATGDSGLILPAMQASDRSGNARAPTSTPNGQVIITAQKPYPVLSVSGVATGTIISCLTSR